MKMRLDGWWDFSFEGGPWQSQPVPGCFDATGEYHFKKGRGTYRRQVEWPGGLTELSCDGVGLRAVFLWDGQRIGEEFTAFTPIQLRFDAGSPGVHELQVICDNTVEDTPDAQFRKEFDFYGFGGVYRPISLRRLPSVFFDYVRVIPCPDNGSIALHIELGGGTQAIEVTIDGCPCGTLPGPGDATITVPQARLWSPQAPNLHHLRLQCGTDVYECRFGLRKIEAKNGVLYLNGQPMKVAGINRHDLFPDTGAYVSPAQLRHDLTAIKMAGFNMVRGSHYPQSQAMLDLADELGIMVWDETLGWEYPAEALGNAVFQRRQCDALTRMIRASVNHPCIVFWGFLNEAFTDSPEARECVGKLCQVARSLDPSRLLTYATMLPDKDLCLDLIDVVSVNIYPGWYSGAEYPFNGANVRTYIEELLAKLHSQPKLAGKPLLISEIGGAALIGDHSGRRWSEEYQAELVECAVRNALSLPDCAGLLLWQFCDSPAQEGKWMLSRPRGYNNKGLVDEYRRPKLAWSLFPQLLEECGIVPRSAN